jgi:toluene monooxygenase system protein E
MAVLEHELWQHLASATEWSPRLLAGARNGSALHHADWGRFDDPSGIVYHRYSALQGQQESFVHALFDQMSERGHDGMLEREWAHSLARFYTPLRFPFQGLKMMSGRLMTSGPVDRIANCAAYQAGDHIRWVDHTAYRTAELAQTFRDGGFGRNERQVWETDAAWQPLRELVEQAMALKDWGELFCVLNLVLKPCVEEGIMTTLADVAGRADDTVLPMLVNSQLGDARRHKAWARALVSLALEEPGNRAVLGGWLESWMPLADRAIKAYCLELPDGETLASRARLFIGSFHVSMGIA